MKKAKIMLMAIAVLATVGTALAFKVKTVGNKKYVYSITDTRPTASECTLTIQNATALATGPQKIYYTETTNLANAGTLECPLEARAFGQ